jgi:hypothetical protein
MSPSKEYRTRLVSFTAVIVLLSGTSCDGPKTTMSNRLSCSRCDLELPHAASMLDKPCPKCKQGKLVSTGPGGKAEAWWLKIMPWAVLLLVVGEAGIVVWVARRRLAQRETNKPVVLRCRCPRCQRKFAYLLRQAGQSMRCPRCKTEFSLPIGEGRPTNV